MNELTPILDSQAALSAFIYGSVLAVVAFGACVSWLRLPVVTSAR